MINRVFWTTVAIEALFFICAFVMTATQSGHSDGGREMAMFFQILLPFAILGICALIFRLTGSPVAHWVLLALVVIPPGWLAQRWIGHWQWERENGNGQVLFNDRPAKDLVAAIGGHDVDKVGKFAAIADVNAIGADGWTPLKWAVRTAWEAERDLRARDSDVEIVRILLSHGAKPDPGLSEACRSNRIEILRALLDAGGNINVADALGTPAYFACFDGLRPTSVPNLQLAADRGANFQLTDFNGNPPIVAAAIFHQYDVVAFFLDRGVSPAEKNRDGKTAASYLDEVIARSSGAPVPDTLAQLRKRLP